MNNETKRPAGNFSEWLSQTRSAFIDEKGVTVACGDCKACCTSSYFVHIRPEEKATLKAIDKKLLFPALGLPKGNMLMGYYENGYCPMMTERGCKIYLNRPITCRNYDCRVFTAAGIAAGGDDKAQINERAGQWQFSYPTEQDKKEHDAVKEAANFIQNHADSFPQGTVPSNPSQIAILAIKTYTVFLEPENQNGSKRRTRPDIEVARAVIEAVRAFEAQRS